MLSLRIDTAYEVNEKRVRVLDRNYVFLILNYNFYSQSTTAQECSPGEVEKLEKYLENIGTTAQHPKNLHETSLSIKG